MEIKLCFLSEANYPNYVKRVKDFNIKRYLELDLDIPFYISTNFKSEFKEYENHPYIKVFDIEELRKNDEVSKKNEPLPEDPTGIYPARYPWNLRRFILRKAAEDGYNALYFLECDTKIKDGMDKNEIIESMISLYEPNTVKTSSARFVYKNRHPNQELFYYHPKYIEDLNLTFEEDEYDTLDGTNQIFLGKDTESLQKFFDNWDFICNYGYEKVDGYKTGYLSNLSFVIPMSEFKLIHTGTPFITNHVYDDRY
jgi:hypothetical protein